MNRMQMICPNIKLHCRTLSYALSEKPLGYLCVICIGKANENYVIESFLIYFDFSFIFWKVQNFSALYSISTGNCSPSIASVRK